MDYWEILTKYFANNTNVLGYDPLNEPWPANFYHDFSLFYIPWKFDQTILYPLL